MSVIGVNVAVIRDGKVLLTKRDDFHVWCLPGGHLDSGESFPEAAVREVREETGYEVRLTGFVGGYSRPLWGEYHILLFAAEVTGGAERPQPGEVVEMGFFGPDELPGDLMTGQRHRILDALEGRRSVFRRENFPPPIGVPRGGPDLYAARDASGLSPLEFYRRTFMPIEEGGTSLEVE